MNLQTTKKLNNGVEIPYFGLGVFLSPQGEETQNAVRWALEAGYRHIDTAASVHKERIVANADVFDFELTKEEMAVIDGLNENRRFGSDPDNFNF